MKTTLLKMFRRRFEVIRFGENSWALIDHKDERIIYKMGSSELPLVSRTAAIQQGVAELVSYYEYYRFITTRRKRMYRSVIAKR